MDNLCKTILNYLRDQGEGCAYICCFFDNEFDDACNALGIDVENARAAVRYLHENNYLDYSKTTSNHTFGFSLSHKGLNYESFTNQDTQSNTASQIFNIGQVHNSALGNTGDVIINNGASFDEIINYIATSSDIPDSDRQTLRDMAITVKTMTENEVPLKKGFLSKFSSFAKEYGPLFAEISGKILRYFLEP